MIVLFSLYYSDQRITQDIEKFAVCISSIFSSFFKPVCCFISFPFSSSIPPFPSFPHSLFPPPPSLLYPPLPFSLLPSSLLYPPSSPLPFSQLIADSLLPEAIGRCIIHQNIELFSWNGRANSDVYLLHKYWSIPPLHHAFLR